VTLSPVEIKCIIQSHDSCCRWLSVLKRITTLKVVIRPATPSCYLCPSKETPGFPRWLSGKESIFQCRSRGFNPWVWKIPWRGKWQPAPVFLPGESMDRGAWRTTVHGVAKSPTWLSNLTIKRQPNFKMLSIWIGISPKKRYKDKDMKKNAHYH